MDKLDLVDVVAQVDLQVTTVKQGLHVQLDMVDNRVKMEELLVV